MYVGINNISLRQFTPYSTATPTSLLAAGYTGAWFDPSDTTTMWQDSLGQTAAVVDQPVGLMLDKSQSLGETTLVTLTFDDATGLSLGAGATVGSGTLNFSASSSTTTHTLAPTIGKAYKVTYTVTRSAGSITVALGGVSATTRSSAGTFTDYIVTTATTSLRFTSSSFTGTLDDVVVKEILCTPVFQSTASARPILRNSGSVYWLEFDGVDDTLTGPASNTSYNLTATHFMIAAIYRPDTTVTSNALMAAAASSTLYHRIGSTTSSRSQYTVRTAEGSNTVNSTASAFVAATPNVIDTQAQSGGTLNGTTTNTTSSNFVSLSTTHTTNQGNCVFQIGATTVEMRFYGLFAVKTTALTAPDIAALRRHFGTAAGVTL